LKDNTKDNKGDSCRHTWTRTSPLASHFNVTAVGRAAVDVGLVVDAADGDDDERADAVSICNKD
jgi:hypothetical protein